MVASDFKNAEHTSIVLSVAKLLDLGHLQESLVLDNFRCSPRQTRASRSSQGV